MLNNLIVLVLFMFCACTYAQNSNDTIYSDAKKCDLNTNLSLRINDIKSPNNIYKKTVLDFSRAVTAPIYWRKDDYLKFGAIVAAASTLYIFDEDIYNRVNQNKSEFTRFTTKYVFEPFGNYTTITLLAGMTGYGLIFHKERPTTTAILATESLILAGILAQIPKRLAGRERPYNTHPLNSKEWNGWNGGTSFWSGHTTAAFSVASVIAEMYDDRPVIGFVAYSAATLAGISRIHDQKHWASDVFIGAVVGTAIGKLVVKSYNSNRLLVTPLVAPENTGLYLSFTF